MSSKPLLVVFAAALAACASHPVAAPVCCEPESTGRVDAAAIKSDITYLASDALEGRGTGTPGNDSAAAYIARRFAALRLEALGDGFRQPFVAHPLRFAHEGPPQALPTQNVV